MLVCDSCSPFAKKNRKYSKKKNLNINEFVDYLFSPNISVMGRQYEIKSKELFSVRFKNNQTSVFFDFKLSEHQSSALVSVMNHIINRIACEQKVVGKIQKLFAFFFSIFFFSA